jgi:hypothetical protein
VAAGVNPPGLTIGNRHYETLDSGKRKEFPSGMRRDLDEGKPRYDLIPLMPLRRLAELYARGAEKYGDTNWLLANSDEELQRFRASFLRHAFQWLEGDTDEDHAIAAVWNIFAYLTVEEKLAKKVNEELIEKQRKSCGCKPGQDCGCPCHVSK